MFGGPIDMTPYGSIVKSIGVIYWLLLLGALGLALWKPKRWLIRLLLSALVLLAGIGPVALDYRARAQQQAQSKAQLDAATAHFQMRCKSAVERIYRAVDEVDGIALLRLRAIEGNLGDQYRLDDPYGRDCGGEDCIRSYLIDYRMVPSRGGLAPSNKPLYRFVEVPEPDGDLFVRYQASSARGPLEMKPGQRRTARYGVTWEDVSTPEDRHLWIAGGRLVVVDLQLNEVIAERTGFLFDPSQGSTAGARSPWAWARSHDKACPSVRGHNLTFIEKVLKPKGI